MLKKMSFWFWFIIIVVMIIFQFLYWYFFKGNSYAFFYSLKNASHEIITQQYRPLNLYPLNEDALFKNTLRYIKSKGLNIIVGPNFSATGFRIFKFLEDYDLVAISPSITSTKLLMSTNRILSIVPTNEFQINVIIKFLKYNASKNVLLILDPFNKEYSREFLKILKEFNGEYAYFYSVETFSKDVSKYDSIVITLEPKGAIDFLSYFAPDFRGIIVASDAAIDEGLDSLPDLKNLYVVTFGFKSYNWSNEAIYTIFRMLSKHKFISTNQFVNFYLGHEIGRGMYFNDEGFIEKNISIVNFSKYRKESLIFEGK
ncbi:hypothetical protein XJ44_08745 [Thermosipho affectus]|uniref:Amino acid ABC transporter substrate-binding protein n=2 Tax=Thermosipho affectus TaxID=660294 RepID=A0ABX3IFE5_9BACT|nr:hypothetical protein XJ44_08745 [Thermosipho affectus]